jgi:hypothetical protein
MNTLGGMTECCIAEKPTQSNQRCMKRLPTFFTLTCFRISFRISGRWTNEEQTEIMVM